MRRHIAKLRVQSLNFVWTHVGTYVHQYSFNREARQETRLSEYTFFVDYIIIILIYYHFVLTVAICVVYLYLIL